MQTDRLGLTSGYQKAPRRAPCKLFRMGVRWRSGRVRQHPTATWPQDRPVWRRHDPHNP